MSGIAGIYNLDGRPADRALLQGMATAMLHRGPDGISYWTNGAVGFSHLKLQTTPEALHEKQPLSNADGALCLTFDGRVDNRNSLRTALECKGFAVRDDTDAELVIQSYECWGESCPQQILGDFAFAIWDGRNRKIFCARDIVGIRTFYYVLDRGTFSFSSELRPLLDTPGFRRQLNLGVLGEHLSGLLTNLEETLYRNVLRLPPAHLLVLQDGKVRITQYFQIDPNKSIRYSSDAEYAEHFFDIFKEAVRCRLRSQTPVALFLSGGLDSSSILGMAGYLVDEGTISSNRLATYSLDFSHPEADERQYGIAAAQTWPGSNYRVNADGSATESLADQIRRYQDVPEAPNLSLWRLLCTRARSNGSRVVLWGFGGDEWLTGSPVHCADLLRQLRFGKFLRQLRHDVAIYRLLGEIPTIWNALSWCVFPFVPRPMKSFINRRLRRIIPYWISPRFARAVNLRDRLLWRASAPLFPTKAQEAAYRALVSGTRILAHEHVNRFEADQGMEGRSPLCDRRVIEFVLALPEEQRWRDDQTKYILRKSMAGRLPFSIQNRKSKADFTHLDIECFAKEDAKRSFESLRLTANGYVDGDALQTMFARYLDGHVSTGGILWKVLALDRWINMVGIEVPDAFPQIGRAKDG